MKRKTLVDISTDGCNLEIIDIYMSNSHEPEIRWGIGVYNTRKEYEHLLLTSNRVGEDVTKFLNDLIEQHNRNEQKHIQKTPEIKTLATFYKTGENARIEYIRYYGHGNHYKTLTFQEFVELNRPIILRGTIEKKTTYFK